MSFPTPKEYEAIRERNKQIKEERDQYYKQKEINKWFDKVVWTIRKKIKNKLKNGYILTHDFWFNGLSSDSYYYKYYGLADYKYYIKMFLKSHQWLRLVEDLKKCQWTICIEGQCDLTSKIDYNYISVKLKPLKTEEINPEELLIQETICNDKSELNTDIDNDIDEIQSPYREYSGATGDGLPSDINHSIAIFRRLKNNGKSKRK